MARKYKTNDILSAPFISAVTYIKWIFSWMGQMKIDFRKHIDSWCKYEPQMLACDGDHVGVARRNLNLQNPITNPDSCETVRQVHKR